MTGVRAFADAAEAVERRDAERRGEVAVGAAAGGGFLESRRPIALASFRAG